MNVEIEDLLRELGVFPIFALESHDQAPFIGQALLKGGLPCAEVTFRTAAAAESIRRLTSEFPDLLVGAGTVLSTDQARAARQAGASFIVSPGLNPAVVDDCLVNDFPIFPGVCTPTEIEAALRKGLSILKFFPAEAIGGTNYLQAVSAPFPGVRFLPTGGINQSNLADYLKLDCVLACGGTWLIRSEWIRDGNLEAAVASVAAAVRLVRSLRQNGRA